MSARGRIKAVVFDMDGLLLASEERARAAWLKAAEELGVQLSDHQYCGMIGKSAVDCVRYLMELLCNRELVDELGRLSKSYYLHEVEQGTIPIKPGVYDILDLLDALALPRAVATSTARDLAQRKLDKVGLLSRLPLVVGGDQITKGKPAPDIYLEACRQLGNHPRECLAFEDSPNGLRAASAAGLFTVLVPDLVEPDEELIEMADRVVRSLHEALPLVRGLCGNLSA